MPDLCLEIGKSYLTKRHQIVVITHCLAENDLHQRVFVDEDNIRYDIEGMVLAQLHPMNSIDKLYEEDIFH